MASFFRKATQYQMFVNVRSQIESRFIKVPVWYEPVCIQPPPPPYRLLDKVPNIELPDLSVRDEILERYPELNTPIRVHNFASDYVPIVDRWVTKHRELVAKGLPSAKVWAVMEKEYADYRYRRLVERLTTLEELRRSVGGTVHDELPSDESNTDRQYEDRIDSVDEQLDRQKVLEKYEELRAELEERLELGDYTPLSEHELSEQYELDHAERLEFVKLNPSMRRFFDEHLEMINMHGIDINDARFKDVDYTNADSVDAAVADVVKDFKLKVRVWSEPTLDISLGEVMSDVVDAQNPFEIEADMLQKLALDANEPQIATPEAIEAFKSRYGAASSTEQKAMFGELLRLTAETNDASEFGDIYRQTMPDFFNDKLQAELGVDLDAMSETELAKTIQQRLTPTEDDLLIAQVRKLTAQQSNQRRPKKRVPKDDD